MNNELEHISSIAKGTAGLQNCSPAQSPYLALRLDRMNTSTDICELASCDSQPDLPKIELTQTPLLSDGEPASCDPQPDLPRPELDRPYTLDNGDLASCDPQPDLLVNDSQYPTVIAPWTARKKPQSPQPGSKRYPTPDISQGLGRRKGQKDIVALAKYMKSQLKMLTRKDECGKYVLYAFEPPCWKVLSAQDAQRMILAALQCEELPGSGGENLDDSISGNDARMIYQRLLIDPELFYRGSFELPRGAINFLDGTYNILSDEFYEHRPEDHFTTYVNVAWADIHVDPHGRTFEGFVDNLSDGDPDVRRQLLELTIMPLAGMQFKHFYVLVGESGTGKTQFGRFLAKLVGDENVATVRDINDFLDKWTVGSLQGKQLVTCLDLPNGPLPPSAVGMIKQFVGDDIIKGEKKGKDPFSIFQKPLLLLAGNYPVRLRNMSEEQAMLTRMVCIPFRNPVPPEAQQQQLYESLLEEAPYIIREGIEVFRDLIRRNYQVTRSELPAEFQPEEGNPLIRDVQRYVQEFISFDPQSECTTEHLWNDYCIICTLENGFHQLNKIAFARALTQVLDDMDAPVELLKRTLGTDLRGYKGIAIPERSS